MSMPPGSAHYGLQPRIQILVILASLTLLLVVLNMVRRRHVREQYSLLWIAAAVVLLLSAVFIRFVDRLSFAVGVFYPPAFLLMIAVLLLVVLQVHFSVVISTLREQNKTLTQELGILENELRALKEELGRVPSWAVSSGSTRPPGSDG
jgi:hypothetical protein